MKSSVYSVLNVGCRLSKAIYSSEININSRNKITYTSLSLVPKSHDIYPYLIKEYAKKAKRIFIFIVYCISFT